MDLLIEQKTNYAYKLKYLEDASFDNIKNFAWNFINDLPKELVNELYEELDGGVVAIENEPQMLAYLSSFGNMHQAKLNKAFENLPETFFKCPEINIIDYGCGQAIGTMCYLDFLRQKSVSQKIKRALLIDPSEICLKRAALHVSKSCPDAEIITVNNEFDNLADEDIVCDEDTPTLHILSNVLDITEFDLNRLADLISRVIKGYNLFLCVGPYFKLPKKDDRMENFFSMVNGEAIFQRYYDKYELKEDEVWTCHVNVFAKEDLKVLKSIKFNYSEFERNKLSHCYYDLGECYYNGEGVTQDYVKAVKWYKMAADEGNSVAQKDLGNCYYDGKGVTQDYVEAVEWFRKSAEQGNAQGQNNLGYCYEAGIGVAQDIKKAVEWYRKSAEQGEVIAQNNLGFCYYNGKGVKQDYVEAVNWYRKSAEQGNSEGQRLLGLCYYSGKGVTQDYVKAVEWYRKSAEQGNPTGQCRLGDCYYDGKGVTQDYVKAVEWYRKSAEQGNEKAQRILKNYFKSVSRKNSYYRDNSYGEFEGSYAQDVIGYDDDTINDAFEGDPDLYWNID